ncbi:glycosyltransferase [Thiorhodovibrio frisius]|uniref:Glycosyl transferase, UDP-glucuronosyltransferase n=1 Tax=Thiorhodovibrio frisius TaxID=631362 RepID=H8Z1V1_9GAMM|nr:glycosyltransferase [Thiorhodovibrio frisius]EIC22579.1 glycosyl transferase, UDP-glucuronosyltransferase [Thiorhodovibrio frisius]WPL20020.1 glycosyltransferase, MGT family [Thiorhodovibrio frisius]
MGRALVIAKGSFGDIIPLYAVAQALQERGHEVLLATQSGHLQAARALGLKVLPIDGQQDPTAAASKRPLRALSWISNDAFGGSASTLRYELDTLIQHSASVDLVIGNQLALSGPLVAGHLRRPWVYCAVSPMGLVSRDNPCLFPLLHGFQRACAAHPWAHALSQALVHGSSRLLSGPLRQEQARLGLTHLGHPRFEGLFSRELNLLLTSPRFLSHTPSIPPNTLVTGITWLEADFLGHGRQLQRALDFIRSGSPPILFALGGNARANPGDYFQESLNASRALEARALIIAATRFHAQVPSAPDVHLAPYLPYSTLFPLVRAVVHSGGIGTIGWALRCAQPSLLVPQADDQFDNSHRTQSRGWARVLPRRHYRAPDLSQAIQETLADTALHARLQQLAPLLAAEQGARIACDHLERFFCRR